MSPRTDDIPTPAAIDERGLDHGAPEARDRGSLLRVHEAAEKLNCSISTVRRLIREKKLPAYRVGHGIRVAEADLERVLQPVR